MYSDLVTVFRKVRDLNVDKVPMFTDDLLDEVYDSIPYSEKGSIVFVDGLTVRVVLSKIRNSLYNLSVIYDNEYVIYSDFKYDERGNAVSVISGISSYSDIFERTEYNNTFNKKQDLEMSEVVY